MPCSSELTRATPFTPAAVVGVELLSSPPDWLITISATITATAAKPARARYCVRRFLASCASASCDSAAWRSARRRSLSLSLPSMRGLYLWSTQLPARVREGAGGGDTQRQRHDNRAPHAPLADRVDHEERQVRQVGTEANPDQGGEEPADPPRVARPERRHQQDDVAEDP